MEVGQKVTTPRDTSAIILKIENGLYLTQDEGSEGDNGLAWNSEEDLKVNDV